MSSCTQALPSYPPLCLHALTPPSKVVLEPSQRLYFRPRNTAEKKRAMKKDKDAQELMAKSTFRGLLSLVLLDPFHLPVNPSQNCVRKTSKLSNTNRKKRKGGREVNNHQPPALIHSGHPRPSPLHPTSKHFLTPSKKTRDLSTKRKERGSVGKGQPSRELSRGTNSCTHIDREGYR